MKKALFVLLAVILTLSLAACVAAPSGKPENTTETPVQTTAPVENNKPALAPNPAEEPVPTEAPKPTEAPAPKKAQEKDQSITEAEAKNIALKHAGVSADKIRDYDIEKDMEGGVLYYEIDFESGGYEYDYLIRVEDGKILRNEKEPEFD